MSFNSPNSVACVEKASYKATIAHTYSIRLRKFKAKFSHFLGRKLTGGNLSTGAVQTRGGGAQTSMGIDTCKFDLTKLYLKTSRQNGSSCTVFELFLINKK